MNHRIGYNRLSRSSAHRLAMHRNMATSLFRYERITTTKAKALSVRRTAEKMITRAKVDSVHNRRTIGKDIKDKEILAKLFTEIGPRFSSRPGGYTRILKIGMRKGDAAEMVILELVEKKEDENKEKKAKKSKGAAGEKAVKAEKKSPEKKASVKKEVVASEPKEQVEAAGVAEEPVKDETADAKNVKAAEEKAAEEKAADEKPSDTETETEKETE
jgi:large subunit ribosomal protein L17